MSAIAKIGKKGKRNIRVNLFLKEMAIAQSLPERCEAEYLEFRNKKGELICNRTFGLSWAHAKRRPYWTDECDEVTAGLLCIPCHTHAQNLGNDKNERIILEIERRRGWSFADFLPQTEQTCPCVFCDCQHVSEYGEICGFCLLGCRVTEELELNRVY